jgi:hypothetical protein
MNASALVVAVSLSLAGAGCAAQDPGTGKNVGPGDPDPNADLYACHSDADCAYPRSGGPSCAVDGDCDTTVVAHISWTMSGQPASKATCAAAPELDLTFWYDDEGFGYSPVPCAEGQFTVDNFPIEYTRVQASVGLLRDGDRRGGSVAMFDFTTDTVTLDLPYSAGPSQSR